MEIIKKCERCHQHLSCWTMSWFNTQHICMKCAEKEKQHPKYKEAVQAIKEAETKGNMNFEGIGLPEDLKL